MRIYIDDFWSNSKIAIETEALETIEELKHKLQKVCGKHEMRFVFAGRELNDEETVWDCMLAKNCVIYNMPPRYKKMTCNKNLIP